MASLVTQSTHSSSNSLIATPDFSYPSSLSTSSSSLPSTCADSDIAEYSQKSFHSQKYTAAIFDLGDVIVHWTPNNCTSLPLEKAFAIYNSYTWTEYEKGKLTEQEAYASFAEEFEVPAAAIAEAAQAARDTMVLDMKFLNFIKDMKAKHNLSVYAMSNISLAEWEALHAKATPEDWAVFDHIFISAEVQERKPELAFYRHVLQETGVDSSTAIFVDDKVENVVTARSMGLSGIVFDNAENVMQKMRNMISDPVQRAQDWLSKHEGESVSITNRGDVISENLSEALILGILGDARTADPVPSSRKRVFFKALQDEGNKKIYHDLPPELDTTSITLTAHNELGLTVDREIPDEMLDCVSDDGISGVYFSRTRPELDPIACTNVLTLFHTLNRGQDLRKTEDWIYSVLDHRAYADGSLHYCSPDAFIYFLSRLTSASQSARERFGFLLSQRVRERIGVEGDALALAMRILAAQNVGIQYGVDYERLRGMQEADGSWPVGWLRRHPVDRRVSIGNKRLTTAFAWKVTRAHTAVDSCR